MRFNFSPPLGMGRVTGKYMKIECGDGEGKTRPHPIAMPNYIAIKSFYVLKSLHIQKSIN